ncbi:site-specific integrase [Salibacterium lacus]|uniref:Tyrosine-type recombinase/integrase n=1 Tax=Salibacterium lacus TaxID=1898109 RepID=A0ABW5SYC3_9BACI
MRGYVRKRGKSYSFTIDIGRDPSTGQRKQKTKGGFKNSKDCEKAMNDMIHLLQHDEFVDTKKMMLKDFVEDWIEMEEMNYRPSTFSVYKSIINNRLIPAFGHAYVDELKPIDIQKYYNRMLKEGLTPKYILSIHNVLRALISKSVTWEVASKNVMDKVTPPKGKRKEMQTWTLEQSKQFLDHAKENTIIYPVFVLAIWTGMRKGEIYGLKWKDIDFENNRIQVNRTMAWARGQGHILQDAKTDGSRRTIKASDHVMSVLNSQLLKQKQIMMKLGERHQDDNLVFLSYNGKPMSMRHAGERLVQLSKELGLPRIRMHDLRHTHATISLELKQHPKVVSERLGHKSIDITLDLYSHVTENLQEESANEFERAMNQK